MIRFFLFLFLLISCSYSQADETLDSLHHGLSTAKNKEEQATFLNDIGTVMYRKGDFDKAVFYVIQSAKILEELKDSSRLYKRYFNIGAILSTIGQYRKGIYYLEMSKEISLVRQDTFMLGQTLGNLGTIYNFMDMNDSAMYYYQRAAQLHELRNDSISLAGVVMNMGNIYDKEKDHINSLKYFQRSLNLIEPHMGRYEVLHKRIAVESTCENIYDNIGHTYVTVGELEKGMYYLEKVVNFDSEFASLERKQNAFYAIARAHEKKGDYEKALENYIKHTELKDTLLNRNNLRLINEITIEFEAEKKEKENLALKVKNELAEKNNVLKDEKISLAKSLIIVISLFAVFLLGVLFYVISKNRLIRKLYMEMEEKNAQLNLANQKIELRALLNQINPHFIFNALNSIQQFILKNDTKSSFDYFSKFGSLIRSLLEHSQQNFVPLNEEIEVIENYAALENLRFEDKIEIEVDIGSIDAYSTMIPPMFIQPLLENAIIHGLSEKSGIKKISLVFKEFEDYILCTVIDNGVGRKPLAVKKKKNRNSGLVITEKRLQSIWQRTGDEYNVRFEDLVDEQLQPTGTKVQINLPKSF